MKLYEFVIMMSLYTLYIFLYGAMCWGFAGLYGVMLGAIFLLLGFIIATYIVQWRIKNDR